MRCERQRTRLGPGVDNWNYVKKTPRKKGYGQQASNGGRRKRGEKKDALSSRD